jgi:hypothetical protein
VVPFQVLLVVIGLFIKAAEGISSLQASRDRDVHPKTAFVLLHKLRCALLTSISATASRGVARSTGPGSAVMSGPATIVSPVSTGVAASTEAACAAVSWSCGSAAVRPCPLS